MVPLCVLSFLAAGKAVLGGSWDLVTKVGSTLARPITALSFLGAGKAVLGGSWDLVNKVVSTLTRPITAISTYNYSYLIDSPSY